MNLLMILLNEIDLIRCHILYVFPIYIHVGENLQFYVERVRDVYDGRIDFFP